MFTQKNLSLILLSMFALIPCWGDTPFIPKLVVSGTSLLQKPADQVTMQISVTTQADQAEQALEDNNEKMQHVCENLKSVGLEKGEHHTNQFNIQPIYSTPPRNIPPDWKAHIIAYEVTNSITIKTQKLDLAPLIIDAASQAGITQISNISFGIKDPSIYRNEAITVATANALKDAEVLAKAANIQLIRILDIKLDQPQSYPRPGPNMLYMAKNAGPYLEAPDIDLSANVSVAFEIGSK